MRIQKEIENIERVKDKIATMPLTMEDAIEFHKQVVDRVEKERKEINKELDLDNDIEEKGFTGASKEPKKVSTPELKKMKLAESLFESVLNEQVHLDDKKVNYILRTLRDEYMNQDEFLDFCLTQLDLSPENIFDSFYPGSDPYKIMWEMAWVLAGYLLASKGRFDGRAQRGVVVAENGNEEKIIELLNSYGIKAIDKGNGKIVIDDYLNESLLDESLNEELKYDDIQYMDDSERHDLFKEYHNGEDFEDEDDFWDWAEEEFPFEEMDDFDESLNEGYSITDFNKLKRILKKVADDPNSIVIDPDYTTIDVINGKNCYCIYANGIEDHIIDHITQKLEDDFYTDVEVFDIRINSNNIDFNKLPKAAKEDLEKYGEEELNNSYYICIALKNSVDESLNECDKFKKGDCKNYALDEAKISRQNQRRKKDAYLQRKEAEREKAEKEAREKERIGDAAWGEKDWIAEREKGDLDFSNYSDEERAEIEKRLKAFDNNETAKAQYQRRKEAEEAKRAEEERKKAEQEKEEKTKKNIERIGKLANAPKDIGNAFIKGLGIR